MKRCLALTSIVLLLTSTANAGFFKKPTKPNRSGSSGGVVSEVTDATVIDTETVACAEDVNEQVSYGLLDAIQLNGINISEKQVDSRTGEEYIVVSMPEYISACIEDINLKVEQRGNNIFVGFKVEPDELMSKAAGKTADEKFENCINTYYPEVKQGNFNISDTIEVNGEKVKRNTNVTNDKPFSKKITLKHIDKSKSSEVIFYSPKKSSSFSGQVHKGSPFKTLPSSACYRYETPFGEPHFANEGVAHAAMLLCKNKNNASLANIDEQLKLLTESDTAGNYKALIKTLQKIRQELIMKEADDTIARLNEIEELISSEPAEGEKFGVGKSKAKELGKEYAKLMKKFTDSYGPGIEDELKNLLAQRANAEDDKEIEKIDEKIKKLNMKAKEFARHITDDSEEYALMLNVLKESFDSKSAEKLAKATAYASALSRVYEEDDDEDRGKQISLSGIASTRDKEFKRAKLKTDEWKNEKSARTGSTRAASRKKAVVKGLERRSQTDYKNFQNKMSSTDKYMNEYAMQIRNRYCGSGGDQKTCQYITSQWLPRMMMGYKEDRQKKVANYGNYWSKKYGDNIQQQRALANRYDGLAQQAKFQMMQDRMNSDNPYGFNDYDSDIYSFSGNDYNDFAGYDFGGDFNFSGLPQLPNQDSSQFDMRSPASSGSGVFGNPYFMGPRN